MKDDTGILLVVGKWKNTQAKLDEANKELKALQDTVMALDPFGRIFGLNHCMINGETCNYCADDGCLDEFLHEPDCPVTKLREMLKSQEVSDE